METLLKNFRFLFKMSQSQDFVTRMSESEYTHEEGKQKVEEINKELTDMKESLMKASCKKNILDFFLNTVLCIMYCMAEIL